MKVRIPFKLKYAYWPVELRRKGLTGVFEIYPGPANTGMFLLNDKSDIDSAIKDLEVILETLKLQKESRLKSWLY